MKNLKLLVQLVSAYLVSIVIGGLLFGDTPWRIRGYAGGDTIGRHLLLYLGFSPLTSDAFDPSNPALITAMLYVVLSGVLLWRAYRDSEKEVREPLVPVASRTRAAETGQVVGSELQESRGRPPSILVVGILGIIAGGLGTLAGGFNTFGILAAGIGGRYGGGIEFAYQALGLLLSASNLTGAISILSGRRWGRTLLFLVCSLSIVHGAVFNGILSAHAIGWVISTAILILVLRSQRAEAFFEQRSAPTETRT